MYESDLRRRRLASLASVVATCFSALAIAGCGSGIDPDRPFGDTAVVVIVNPPENEGNTSTPPASVGSAIEGVLVDAIPGGSDLTDATGLAVLGGVSAGPTDLVFDDGPHVELEILRDGDVYDAAVAYDGTSAAFYPGFPIRYGVGGEIVVVGTDEDANDPLTRDDLIVFLEGGLHVGDLVIRGQDVILFGEGFAERAAVVDGNVEVRGGNVRIRGVTITGDLTVHGNNFGMSFSVVEGDTDLQGQAISFLANVFCNGANVPSSNAALYDNEGLAPFAAPGPPICP
jgi:hypothetical protein